MVTIINSILKLYNYDIWTIYKHVLFKVLHIYRSSIAQ